MGRADIELIVALRLVSGSFDDDHDDVHGGRPARP